MFRAYAVCFFEARRYTNESLKNIYSIIINNANLLCDY